MDRDYEMTYVSARKTAAHAVRASCSACQNRDNVGCAVIVRHFLGDVEERAGAILSVLDVTTSSGVGCLVTDLVPQ